MTRSARTLSGIAGLVIALATACGTDPEEPAADAGNTDVEDVAEEPFVHIGTGFPSYIAVTEGATLPIIEGIQGGFHLWGGFEVSGLQPSGMMIEFSIEWNGAEIGGANYVDDLWDDTDPYEYAGVAVIFDNNDLPTQVSGETVTLSVRLEDTAGVIVSDSVEVIAECCSF